MQDRKSRIIARGEHSNHSHIITGDAIIRNQNGEIIVEIGQEECILKHLMESNWLNGEEKWTEEHLDISLSQYDKNCKIGQIIGRQGDVALEKIGDRTYKYIPQVEYDPYNEVIRNVLD